MPDQLFIAVCGAPASGKDAVGDYLAANYRMQHVSAGDVLRSDARSAGLAEPFSRETLGEINDRLEVSHGPGPISRRALEQYAPLKADYPGGLVISGIRRIPEVERVKQNHGVIIYIEAPDDQRYARLERRAREDHSDMAAFLRREQDELNGTTAVGKGGIWIYGVRAQADCIIENDDTLATLYKRVDQVLQHLGKQQ